MKVVSSNDCLYDPSDGGYLGHVRFGKQCYSSSCGEEHVAELMHAKMIDGLGISHHHVRPENQNPYSMSEKNDDFLVPIR